MDPEGEAGSAAARHDTTSDVGGCDRGSGTKSRIPFRIDVCLGRSGVHTRTEGSGHTKGIGEGIQYGSHYAQSAQAEQTDVTATSGS